MSVADDHDPAKAGDGGLNPQKRQKGRPARDVGDPALAEALAAVGRGWAVLPVAAGGKAALLKSWPRAASDDPAKVAAWAARYPGCNFGVLCGRASGIVVLDVDPRSGGTETLDARERERGTLPVTAEVLTGGGGRHLYFANPGQTIKSRKVGPGVECRAERLYVVLPGSTHPDGKRYQWRNGRHLDEVELADPPGWMLDAGEDASGETEDEPQSGRLAHAWSSNGCAGDAGVGGPADAAAVLADPDAKPRIDAAVRATLPTTFGTRNRRLFDLARRLKGIPEVADMTADGLRPVVLDWFDRASPHVRTKTVSVTLDDFRVAWSRVERPHGQILLAARQGAAGSADPPNLPPHYGEHERFATRFCRALSRRQGGGTWFLSGRDLADHARAAGVASNKTDAAAVLRTLAADGVLAVVTPGGKVAGSMATVYRYLLPDADGEGGAA